MTIVERLRGLIAARGGVPTGVMTIAEGVKKLEDIENDANPLSALVVDADIGAAVDLLGKVVGDLQKDVVVGPHAITGELYYIDDYTGFSGNPEEQQGWYLVVHAEVPDVSDVTIKIKNSVKPIVQTLDPSDGILIQRLTDWHLNQDVTLTFTAQKSGYPDFSKTFELKGLTLDPPEDD